MRAQVATLLVSLAVAATARADISGPTAVSAKVGRLATVTLTHDCDEIDYALLGDAADGFREFDAEAKRIRIRVIGYEPGTAYLVAWGQKGGKLVPKHIVTITVGGAPVPPPPPDPTPISPLAKALKDAAAKDGWPAVKLADAAIAFQVCANLPAAGRTAAQGEQARSDSLKKNLAEGVPPTVYAVVAAQQAAIQTLLPPSAPDHVVTDAEAAKVKAVYDELAAACREAVK